MGTRPTTRSETRAQPTCLFDDRRSRAGRFEKSETKRFGWWLRNATSANRSKRAMFGAAAPDLSSNVGEPRRVPSDAISASRLSDEEPARADHRGSTPVPDH